MIPIALPLLAAEEAEAARAAVLSGSVSQGPEVAAFEREFARIVGAPHACAVSNCTSALHIALKALGIGSGDEVITASHSFIATANCIRYCGATPVFVDIERDTYNIDPKRIAEAITPRTGAIIVVHQMGTPCDIAAIVALAERHGLPVVEDAACAVGSMIRIDESWEPIGRPRGAIACFSFHPRMVITTGEGGMLTTADATLDRQFRLLRQHGVSVSDAARHGSREVMFEDYLIVGFDYRMTDVQAAIGRRQLERLPELVARRRAVAARYAELLGDIEGLVLPFEPDWARSNWQSYCVRLPDRIGQRSLMQKLLDREIATRRGVMCSHRERPYANSPPRHDLRRSERAQDHAILLPIYAQLAEDQQASIANAVSEALQASTKSYSQLRDRA